MPEIQASRRLVKSPPELWAEVSDAASLARHLGEVGEITITRLEPETTVAWEGEHASGTVELAPAGWGTSVTFTAEPIEAVSAQPEADTEPTEVVSAQPEASTEPTAAEPARAEREPAPEPQAVAAAKPEPVAAAEPEPVAAAEPEPQPDPATAATPARRPWFARLFQRRTPRPATTPEPEPSATDADRAGGSEDARAPADRPVCAHPELTGPARSSAEPEPEPEPQPQPEPQPEPEPVAEQPKPKPAAEKPAAAAADPLEAVLSSALDSLGQAHHRPFSRG
jgi:hypothetical protein